VSGVAAGAAVITGEDVTGEDEATTGEATTGEATTGEAADVPLLRFVRPVPGFPGLDRFVLVRLDGGEAGLDGDSGSSEPDDPMALFELRSVQEPDVRFLVGAAAVLFPDYWIDLDEQACIDLELTDASDALVLLILTVGADPGSTTANLLAPVVINGRTRAAAQVILSGSDWPVRAAVA
jgi:flagellar assembly factor FliW